MKVHVHYYAAARELAGCEQEAIDLEHGVAPQARFRAVLTERHPRLGSYLQRMRLAVNGDFVDEAHPLEDGDRVDVLPPVAGGSSSKDEAKIAMCVIAAEPIRIDDVRLAVTHAGAGAISFFTGIVRDHADGKLVSRLDYEAHETLAQKEMHAVLIRVVEEHPDVRVAAVHRVGQLAIGDVAVCVAVSAPHREAAFDACRKAIDRIKETVPIWKKEWGNEGDPAWVNLES